MATNIFGKRIYRLESVPSTQDALKEQFNTGAPIGSIAVATEQSLGRGRRGRTWDSPAGKGLWMSVLIAPSEPEEYWTWVPLWVGLVAKNAIEAIAAESNGKFKDQIQLKWPNDLIFQERKLGGLLAEQIQNPNNRKAIVLGIGINLLQTEDDFPPHLRKRAISLLQAVGEWYSPELLLEKVIFKLEEMYPLVNPLDTSTIKELWLKSAWGWKESLEIYSGGRSYNGIFTQLGPHGEIGLQGSDKKITYLPSAEGIQRLETA